ncbi:MAG: hypothetical protein K2Y27_07620 [Xanthobacteraceae bacterium]|nr:hypothetical protein [Xanthobacteraceae bacterium]
MRLWAAAGMAAFYVVCLLAPVAAFAFGSGEAHCLTKDSHGLGSVHVHDDGAVHRHVPEPPAADVPDGTDESKVLGKCCGLVCVAAMLPAFEDGVTPTRHPFVIGPTMQDALLGSIPARLYRPPAPAI